MALPLQPSAQPSSGNSSATTAASKDAQVMSDESNGPAEEVLARPAPTIKSLSPPKHTPKEEVSDMEPPKLPSPPATQQEPKATIVSFVNSLSKPSDAPQPTEPARNFSMFSSQPLQEDSVLASRQRGEDEAKIVVEALKAVLQKANGRKFVSLRRDLHSTVVNTRTQRRKKRATLSIWKMVRDQELKARSAERSR